METLELQQPDGTVLTFVVITREDGSKLTIEANESNPEYAALIAPREE